MSNFISDMFGGGQTYNTTTSSPPVQLPDYAEANQARGTWGNTLQSWAGQPGYGAIQPDWNSIWQNAAGKVQRYYNGGPGQPGLIDSVNSNNAARGVAENPAGQEMKNQMGMQEGLQMQDLATTQAQQQAALEEQGRTTWLNSLMQLSGLKPQFSTPTTTTKSNLQQNPMSALAPVGTMLGNGSASGALNSMGGGLQSLMGMFGMGGVGAGAIGGAAGTAGAAGAGAGVTDGLMAAGAGMTDMSSLLPMLMAFV